MHVQVSLTLEISATASIAEMEQRIQEAGKPPMREALKQAIRQWEDQNHTCPSCREKQRRLEGTTRRVIATTFGRVEVPRRRFRCQECLRRWCPANHLFAQLKGGTISVPLQEAARLSGCSWPYRVASGRLEEAEWSRDQCGRDPSTDQPARQATSGAPASGGRAGMLLPCQQTPSAQNAEQPMLVGLDGGWVCSREQRGGMEGKVAVVCSRMEDLPMPTY